MDWSQFLTKHTGYFLLMEVLCKKLKVPVANWQRFGEDYVTHIRGDVKRLLVLQSGSRCLLWPFLSLFLFLDSLGLVYRYNVHLAFLVFVNCRYSVYLVIGSLVHNFNRSWIVNKTMKSLTSSSRQLTALSLFEQSEKFSIEAPPQSSWTLIPLLMPMDGNSGITTAREDRTFWKYFCLSRGRSTQW